MRTKAKSLFTLFRPGLLRNLLSPPRSPRLRVRVSACVAALACLAAGAAWAQGISGAELARYQQLGRYAELAYDYSVQGESCIKEGTVLAKIDDRESGLQALAVEVPGAEPRKIVIAFAGTNLSEDRDVEAVWALARGKIPAQVDQAENFLSDVILRYPAAEIELTGHSLGGTIASYLALKHHAARGVKATAFNAFGLGGEMQRGIVAYTGQPVLAADAVTHVRIACDPVSGQWSESLGAELIGSVRNLEHGQCRAVILDDGRGFIRIGKNFLNSGDESRVHDVPESVKSAWEVHGIEAVNKVIADAGGGEAAGDPPVAAKATPTYYGVFVGLDEYESGWQEATKKAGSNDCLIFKDLCTKRGKWEENNITVLQNREATKRNTLDMLNHYLTKLRDNDVLVFFITTHGSLKPGVSDSVVVTYEKDGVISGHELRSIFNRAPTQKYKIIAIISACQSEAMMGDILCDKESAMPVGKDARPVSGGGQMVCWKENLEELAHVGWITAASFDQNSLSTPSNKARGNMSEFMRTIADGWENGYADSDQNGEITFLEVAEYARKFARGALYEAKPPKLWPSVEVALGNTKLLAGTVAGKAASTSRPVQPSPPAEFHVSSDSSTVGLSWSEGGDATYYRVYRGGAADFNQADLILSRWPEREWTFTDNTALSSKYYYWVTSVNNWEESEPMAGKTQNNNACYGVFVGLDESEDNGWGEPRDGAGSNDCKLLADLCVARGQWNPNNIAVLRNRNATKQAVLNQLSADVKKLRDNDVLVFFISAPGGSSPKNDNDFVVATYEKDGVISGRELRDIFAEAPTKKCKIIAIVSACHTEAMVAGFYFSNSFNTSSATRKKSICWIVPPAELPHVGWITAASYDQRSSSGATGERSVSELMQTISDGWQGYADSNQNGEVTFLEMAGYAQKFARGAFYHEQHKEPWPSVEVALGNTNLLAGTVAGKAVSTPQPVKPSPPSGFYVAFDPTNAHLDWSKGGNAAYYRVYRGDTVDFNKADLILSRWPRLNFTDKTRVDKHCYWVTSVNGWGESEPIAGKTQKTAAEVRAVRAKEPVVQKKPAENWRSATGLREPSPEEIERVQKTKSDLLRGVDAPKNVNHANLFGDPLR
jgi:hypothetical protein